MEARELYCSPLIRMERVYAERHRDRWFILSAKCGLVAPERVIEPYDETLKDKRVAHAGLGLTRFGGTCSPFSAHVIGL